MKDVVYHVKVDYDGGRSGSWSPTLTDVGYFRGNCLDIEACFDEGFGVHIEEVEVRDLTKHMAKEKVTTRLKSIEGKLNDAKYLSSVSRRSIQRLMDKRDRAHAYLEATK